MNSLRVVRRGLWQGGGRPFWCSLLAVLAMHGVLAWGLASHHLVPFTPTAPQPMQVRLAAEPHAGERARPSAQAALPVPRLAMPVQPPRAQVLAQTAPSPRPVQTPAAVPQAAAPRNATTTNAPAPAAAPQTPAHPHAAPLSAATPLASATPSLATPSPAPPSTAIASPTTQAGATAATVARTGTDGPAAPKAPVDMPSASISYLVQPVLTFPPGSEELGESGSVTLRVLVDEKGVPSKVERLQSSGYPRLDQHAASVIRRARFVPHQVQGESRAAWATVTLNFRLN